MSSANLNLEGHWTLAEIDNGLAPDSSGRERHGTIVGTADIVADDQFGACLFFDGSSTMIEVGTATDLGISGASFTIEAWINGQSFTADNTILGTAFSGGVALDRVLQAIVRAGNPYFGFFNDDIGSATVLNVDQWYHLAWRFDHSSRQQAIFVDGVLDTTNTSTGIFESSDPLRIGRWNADTHFHGKMSNVRVYSRALDEAEIQADMLTDLSARAAFRSTHPLDCCLLDDDDQQTLYIVDDDDSRSVNLELRNSGSRTIELMGSGAAQASSDDFHFALYFRPGVLTAAAQAAIALDPSITGWSLYRQPHGSGAFSLYLLNTSSIQLDAGKIVKLILTGINVDPTGGSRGTRLLYRYNNIGFVGENEVLNGNLTQHLSLVNQRGKRSVPLHFGFVGSNTIVNDGQSLNSLTLRISNTIPGDTLALGPIGSAAPTTFTLFFDVGVNTVEWALADSVAIQSLDPNVINSSGAPDLNWTRATANAAELGGRPGWSFTTQSTEIMTGGFILIRLADIVSDHPSGRTNAYLKYENLPGYWDGQLIAPIEKTPLVTRAAKVGIGTTAPSGILEIKQPNGDAVKFGDEQGENAHFLSSNRELVLNAHNGVFSFRAATYNDISQSTEKVKIDNGNLSVLDGDIIASGQLKGGGLQIGGGTLIKNIQMGEVLVGPNVGAIVKQQMITFPTAFAVAAPQVFVTALGEAAYSDVFALTVKGVTNMHFFVDIGRVDLLLDNPNQFVVHDWNQQLKLFWLAIEM